MTTAAALALVFPPAFALVAWGVLAVMPAKRRAAMDQLVADQGRLLAGSSILAGLAALLVGLVAFATVGDETAIYASADVILAGYIIGAGWLVWRETAEA